MNKYYKGSDSISKTENGPGDCDLKVIHFRVCQSNHRVNDADTVPHYSTSLPWEQKTGGGTPSFKSNDGHLFFSFVLIKHVEHFSPPTEPPMDNCKQCISIWNYCWSQGIISALELDWREHVSRAESLWVVWFRKEKLHSPQIVTHALLYRQPNYIKIITFKDKPVSVYPSACNVT